MSWEQWVCLAGSYVAAFMSGMFRGECDDLSAWLAGFLAAALFSLAMISFAITAVSL